jgi:hypothetical protein
MVKVASALLAGAVARGLCLGIVLPLLPATALLLMKRAWLVKREESPAALKAEGLEARIAARENMLSGDEQFEGGGQVSLAEAGRIRR